jgi:hypothetical protein
MTPRITFGMIALNSEPFIRYNLRALYPFAHEIIVVEGAVQSAAPLATSDGHSLDGTLETLYRFKAEEDPEDKLTIVTKDGFWSEKDEMSQAYAEQAAGNYLWQVDSDEFYKAEDMQAVLEMLCHDPDITAVSFQMLTFWGSPDYITDGWFLRRGANIYHRLFKWEAGYQYITHRPPTVVNQLGQDLRSIKWTTGSDLSSRGIFMYHYSLLLPKQVQEKSAYYGVAFPTISGGQSWAESCFMRLEQPFHVHNVYRYPSWLSRFEGNHPSQILQMWDDLKAGKYPVLLRPMSDVEALLASWWYRPTCIIVKYLDYPARISLRIRTSRVYQSLARRIKPFLNRIGLSRRI